MQLRFNLGNSVVLYAHHSQVGLDADQARVLANLQECPVSDATYKAVPGLVMHAANTLGSALIMGRC